MSNGKFQLFVLANQGFAADTDSIRSSQRSFQVSSERCEVMSPIAELLSITGAGVTLSSQMVDLLVRVVRIIESVAHIDFACSRV
jgi:hypothetical protein